MSSDNNKTPQSGKRKKLIKPDSEDSDESVVQSRRRKKTFVCKRLNYKISWLEPKAVLTELNVSFYYTFTEIY